MNRLKVLCVSAVAALSAGSAFAAQNVANTSQKGSLLVWPMISVQPPVPAITGSQQQSTLIEISNDANGTVHVECYYVNERKGRVDFDFDLSAKQTASWDVYTRKGDQVTPPKWPTNTGVPGFAGNPFKGELICFTTNPGREFQISWNHLTGTAVVRDGADAFKYNAWSFAARNRLGVAAPNLVSAPHGIPGILRLSGQNTDGHYDGCPAYNIANFMPNGAELGGFTTLSNSIAVSSCWQDLRQNYRIVTTKLDFTVWNSHEHSFTGAHYCADSVLGGLPLGERVRGLTNGSNFDYDVLQTANARFTVRGVRASPPCPGNTQQAGLLGVIASTVDADGVEGRDGTVGNTLHGAGLLPGLVQWDPAGAVPLKQ